MPLTIDDLTERDIAKTIDHSLLRPELDDAFVEDGCRLAARYDVASVCVRPADVRRAVALLAGTDVAVGTTVGFPHGNHATEVKVFEARRALADGATELDMVLQIGALKSGRDADVEADIRAVAETAHAGGAILKVIFENAYLTDDGEDPRLPPDRGRRGRFRQDQHGLRPDRRDARRPAADARQHVAGHPHQGRRRRAHPRRAAGRDGAGRDPGRRDRHGDDHRGVPLAQGRPHAGGGGPGRRLLMSAAATWLHEAGALLERIEATQAEGIETASQWCADAIGHDGLVHLFGAGHSRIPVEEMFPRYGSYPGFNPMVELSVTFHTQVVGSNGQRQAMFIERTPGLAEVILSNFRFGPHDCMIVFSASGLTALPVEMARVRQGRAACASSP